MEKIRELLKKPWAAYTAATCSAVVLYLLLLHLTGPIAAWLQSLLKMLSPIVTGIILAYLLDPIVKWLERHVFKKIKREPLRHTLAVVLAILVVLILLVLLIITLVPALIDSISGLIGRADSYSDVFKSLLERLENLDVGLDLTTLKNSLGGSVKELLQKLTANMGSLLSKLSGFGSSLVDFAMGVILAIYFMMDKKRLLAGIEKLRRSGLTPRRYETRTSFWRRCHEIFIQYIGCSLLDALIVGAANAVFMAVMGMPYIPLISVIVGVTNILPTFGPVIGGAIGALILVLDKPINALWFLGFTLVLQTADGYIIKPRLFSSSLGIPAVLSLISIILGGKLFGMLGILLAIPVAAVVQFLYTDSFLPWLEKRGRKRLAEDEAPSQRSGEYNSEEKE